jgi:hypothetical protein
METGSDSTVSGMGETVRRLSVSSELTLRFLELVMLAMHLTGGQPARGTEIGSIKFRNGSTSRRNLFIHGGDLFYVTEYHKARSATNLSHIVARFLPECVAQLVVSFIAFIRPFSDMLFSHISSNQNSTDGNYLFCEKPQPEEPWGGKHLSRILQQASQAHLGVSLGVWSYRHLTVAVTRRYVKEVAGLFGFKDNEWEKHYEQERGRDVYAWQTGHLKDTNAGCYGLDVAYPSQLQPELLEEYRRISRRWQEWLGFRRREASMVNVVTNGNSLVTPTKRKAGADNAPEIVDPKESPESQKLRRMARNLERLRELRQEERALRETFQMP